MKKHILVSGGHSGIGLELVKRLVAEGHRVGVIVRSKQRQQKALQNHPELKDVEFFYADLSHQAEVKAVAREVSRVWEYVDVLFNNAGVLLDKHYQSPQNREMHYEVNTLSPYYLTLCLKEALHKAKNPQVVNTVTDMLHRQKALKEPVLFGDTKFQKLFGSYMQSKLALTLLMNHLAKEWPEVRIVSVTPGPNKTGMTEGSGMPKALMLVRGLLFASPSKGADYLYKAAFDDSLENLSGIYLQKHKVKPLALKLTANQVGVFSKALET